jgi:hypothetical protein
MALPKLSRMLPSRSDGAYEETVFTNGFDELPPQ